MPDIKILQSILIEAAHMHIPADDEVSSLDQTAKADGSLVTRVDAQLQSAIHTALKNHWPNIPMLGEEMTHEEQERKLGYCENGLWVLDPLDGTTNFTVGFPMYALSLAYIKNGEAQTAVIYDPNRRECFSAQRGEGAEVNGVPLSGSHHVTLANCVANVDYKRLTGVLSERLVSCPPYRSQRNLGSCVLEWCWLAAGRIQLYLHGGQQLWDHAAGYLVLTEAGGRATRLEGGPIRANKLVKQSSIAACNGELYTSWFDWVQQYR